MVVRYLPNATASEELYHHGVDDQKWGVRHGPPYPLDPSPAKQAIRKKKSVGLIQRFKNKRKGKKLREAKERKKKEREEIDKTIQSGDARSVDKIKNKMSNEDLERAITRLDLKAQVSSLKDAEKMRKIDKGASILQRAADISLHAANIASNVADIKGSINKFNKKEDSVLNTLQRELDIEGMKADLSQHKVTTAVNTNYLKELERNPWSKNNIDILNSIKKKG